tara:strand:- start:71 stop:511 length:441 start_codon:yes stop_codon:yes gene_type:complete
MGHTWGQMGNIEGMQYRIDEGVWNFFNPNQIVSENNESSSEVGSLTPLIWNLPIYHNQLSSGFHEIEIRATSDNQYSLPVLVTVYSSSNSVQNQSFSILTIISLCIFVSVAGYSIILQRKNSTFFGISDTQVSDSDDALDAQLIHD